MGTQTGVTLVLSPHKLPAFSPQKKGPTAAMAASLDGLMDSIEASVAKIGSGFNVSPAKAQAIEETVKEEAVQREQPSVAIEAAVPLNQVPAPEVINVDEPAPVTITIESQASVQETIAVESQPSVYEIKSLSEPEPVQQKSSQVKKSPRKADNEQLAMSTLGRPYMSNREEKLLRGSTDTSSVPVQHVAMHR